mgnify:CR=1 FL=1
MRVGAIMNRVKPQGEEHKRNVLSFAGLSIDFDARIVTVDGKRAELSPKEYDLLAYMVQNKNIALTREMLITNVWGYDFTGMTAPLTPISSCCAGPWALQQIHRHPAGRGLPVRGELKWREEKGAPWACGGRSSAGLAC